MKDLLHVPALRLLRLSNSIWRSCCSYLMLLPLGLLATGCSGSGGTANSVSGKVTFKDQPVAGSIVFVYADNKESTAPITEGAYTLSNLQTGAVKVVVRSQPGGATQKLVGTPPPPDKATALPEMKGTSPVGQGVEAPVKYGSAATSPLTFDVKAGAQKKDFPLDP